MHVEQHLGAVMGQVGHDVVPARDAVQPLGVEIEEAMGAMAAAPRARDSGGTTVSTETVRSGAEVKQTPVRSKIESSSA
jgi:hypothetical protein